MSKCVSDTTCDTGKICTLSSTKRCVITEGMTGKKELKARTVKPTSPPKTKKSKSKSKDKVKRKIKSKEKTTPKIISKLKNKIIMYTDVVGVLEELNNTITITDDVFLT